MTIVILANHDVVRVSGSDARQFLQGQLSCNMDLLSPTRTRRGALCNLKGRVIASLRAVTRNDDVLLLCCPGMGERVVATLAKYAVFSKVAVTSEPPLTPVGIIPHGEAPAGGGAIESLPMTDPRRSLSRLPAAIDSCLTLPDGLLIRVGRQSQRVEWLPFSTPSPTWSPVTPATRADSGWRAMEIMEGQIDVTPALAEQYTPQLLNYDISGVIDFHKGCYTGQEVVARMFYRGTPKQRLCLLRCAAPFAEGDAVYFENAPQTPVALLQVAEDGAGGGLANAVLRVAEVQAGTPMGLAGREGAVTAVELAYGKAG